MKRALTKLPHVGLKLAETLYGQPVPSVRRAFKVGDLGLQAVQPRCQVARCIAELLPVLAMLYFHGTVEVRQVLFQLRNGPARLALTSSTNDCVRPKRAPDDSSVPCALWVRAATSSRRAAISCCRVLSTTRTSASLCVVSSAQDTKTRPARTINPTSQLRLFGIILLRKNADLGGYSVGLAGGKTRIGSRCGSSASRLRSVLLTMPVPSARQVTPSYHDGA